jgi:hypothetical protein
MAFTLTRILYQVEMMDLRECLRYILCRRAYIGTMPGVYMKSSDRIYSISNTSNSATLSLTFSITT